jgi:hypothetical protein
MGSTAASVEERLARIEGELLSEWREVRKLLEQVVARERRDRPAAQLLSKGQAAHLLGVSKTRTLGPLINAGLIRTVPKGSRRSVPREEVDRLLREGLPAPGSVSRRRRRAGTAPPSLAPASALSDFARDLLKKRG